MPLHALIWPFRPIRVGRLFGIPILVTPTVVLLVALVLIWAQGEFGGRGAANLALLFGLLAVSLLAHELGHALLARRLGVRVFGISISPLHGAAHLEGLALQPSVEARVALAGPAVNLVLAALAAAVAHPLAQQALWMNLVLGAGNLVPAFPTDGGRALRAWFARRSPLPDATRAALTVSNVFLVALLAAAYHFGAFLLGLLLVVQLYFHGRSELLGAVQRTWRFPTLGFWQVLGRSFRRGAPAEPYAPFVADAPAPEPETAGKRRRLEQFHGSLDEFFRGERPPGAA